MGNAVVILIISMIMERLCTDLTLKSGDVASVLPNFKDKATGVSQPPLASTSQTMPVVANSLQLFWPTSCHERECRINNFLRLRLI